MIDHLLRLHLEPVARDQRRIGLLRTLSLGWLAATTVAGLLILVHRTTGWASPWLFSLLFLPTVGWSLLTLRRARKQPLDFAGIARQIEREHPQLHARLLTAVEQKPDPATQELNHLQTRVIREALAEDLRSKWRQRTERRLKFAQASNAVVLVVLLTTLLALYQKAPARIRLLGLAPNGVTVTPGDTSIEKGSRLVVLAKFTGDLPAEATLVVRPANEPERRLPLVKNLDDPVFGTSLPEIKGELTYRVEYGTEATREFRVTVFEYPRLERADARVIYPAYTGLAEKTIEDTRRVSAVEGSALDYTFHLNKPVKSARLVVKSASGSRRQGESEGSATNAVNSPPVVSGYELAADPKRPNAYVLNFKLETSAKYELILTDDAGRTNRLPPLFVLDALTNRTPELKFAFPRGDQRVSALEEISFQGEASDDFGLRGYGFAYNLAGQEPKFVALGETAGPNEKRTFGQLVALESLGAMPDQLLSYFLWADDVGPDGNPRRTTSDMFFAEVRPFDEVFREGQSQDSSQQQSQQQQSGGGGAAEKLAELQKQIISATWNLQRRENKKTPSREFSQDARTVQESQQKALEQITEAMAKSEDPRRKPLLDRAAQEMKRAIDQLTKAADENAPSALPPALAAEQAAYQALLRTAARETQVARSQRGQSGQSQRGGRAQRQLDQLDLRQAQNRYETERQAAPPEDPKQREQVQAFNRLKELAQRQQDVNERLKELQAALQEARTEAEREELRDRLKRLQEQQQQLLADVDELRQRMERPENQSQMSEARQQLDQTREEVQRASESMNRGEVNQALSSGTRAQRELQQMRDDFRKQSSSKFAEDMKQLRNQARELSLKEDEIGQKLEGLNDANQRRSLTDSEERKELANQLDEQKQRLEELVKHASDITQKAEPVEPLLSRQLYDTLRKAAQDDPKNLQEATEDLLSRGRLRQGAYDRLHDGKDSKKAVEVAANLLREGYSSEANNLEQRARRSITQLKDGVEHAAQSVLGDDTEALRLARNELDDLSRQLERELAQALGGTNRGAGSARSAATASPGESSTNAPGREGQNPTGSARQQARNAAAPGQRQPGQSSDQANRQPGGQRPGAEGNQPGQAPSGSGESRQPAQSGSQSGGGNQAAANDTARPDGESSNRRQGGPRNDGPRNGGAQNWLDQWTGGNVGGYSSGPITGADYTRWSDRLRDVEEMLDLPDLQAQAARIRDRVRTTRMEVRRDLVPPRWDVVKLEIAGPLLELRDRISEELARRESREAVVPIDRDPVPKRYSELVRRYYEELGRSTPAPASPAAAPK